MFQLHYAIPLLLLGVVTGAVVHRSMVLICAVAILSFASTFGIGWGAITIAEIAIGFIIGNLLFGRQRRAAEAPVVAPPPRKVETHGTPRVGRSIVCNNCGRRRTIDQEMMTTFLIRNPIRTNTVYDPSVDLSKLKCTECDHAGAKII